MSDKHALPEHMVDQLILAAEAAVRFRNSTFRDQFNLTELQYRLMAQIRNHSPVSMTKLANLVNRDIAQVSRTIRSLVDLRLVHTAKAVGQLSMSIELSPEGYRKLWQMEQVGEKWDAEVRALMSDKEIDVATHTLEQVYSAARHILEKETERR